MLAKNTACSRESGLKEHEEDGSERGWERAELLVGQVYLPGFSWGHRTTASSTKTRDLLKELDFPRWRCGEVGI